MKIEKMTEKHFDEVMAMMKPFYASPAVLSDGSDEIFRRDIENCINDSPYLEGYVLIENDNIIGYAMAAKSFSTEFGKPCVWIEDLYLKPEHRNGGAGSAFLRFIGEKYPDSIHRLEVERENERAVHVYEKCGFSELPYMEMIRR